MKRLERKTGLILTFMVLAVVLIGNAMADPAGTGTLTTTSTSRGTDASAGQLNAQGGNVTNVDINAQAITAKWAGFYGDVTGSVSLENSGGAIFYNWSDASPTGEVFATRNSATPTWGSIACASAGQISTESTELSLGSGMDNITNTYCATCGNHSLFTVASTQFAADVCTYRSNAYNSSGGQSENWDQVILHDGNFPIYTTIINQDTNGFTGLNYDFQLLVAENSSTSVLTNYYFYVEIA